MTEDEVCWIFGYGSLVWRPAFAYLRREPASISGWQRRFWQGSTDHRGVVGRPGRVVTLIREHEAVCFGMAYQIAPEAVSDTLSQLDHREKGGYERHVVTARLARAAETVGALLYVAGPSNPNYLGPAEPRQIAEQILCSHGPSGHNREYLLELSAALHAIGAADPHVDELVELVNLLDPG